MIPEVRGIAGIRIRISVRVRVMVRVRARVRVRLRLGFKLRATLEGGGLSLGLFNLFDGYRLQCWRRRGGLEVWQYLTVRVRVTHNHDPSCI